MLNGCNFASRALGRVGHFLWLLLLFAEDRLLLITTNNHGSAKLCSSHSGVKKKNSVGISALVLASEGKSVSARNVWSGQYQGEI